MYNEDSINKTCWKNGKDLSNRAPKLNFEIIPKKRIFWFLPKISAGHGWSWNFFFANLQILGPLGCQGWVVIPQNVKKSPNHCTLLSIPKFRFRKICLNKIITRSIFLSTKITVCKIRFGQDNWVRSLSVRSGSTKIFMDKITVCKVRYS